MSCLVRKRWGRPRSPSHSVRVSPYVFGVLSRVLDVDRRAFLDRAVRSFVSSGGLSSVRQNTPLARSAEK